MPQFNFNYYDGDVSSDITTHSKQVSGHEYDYLPAIIQAFNEFLIGVGFTYLETTVQQPVHGVYVIHHKTTPQLAAAAEGLTYIAPAPNPTPDENGFAVGDRIIVTHDYVQDASPVAGLKGTIVGIDPKARPSQPYEIAFDDFKGGHNGKSGAERAPGNLWFLTHYAFELLDSPDITPAG